MAKEEKETMVNVYIPREAMNSNEDAKKVFINDVMYSVPVGKNVPVPASVAKIITDWLDKQTAYEEERKARMEELNQKMK